MNKQNTKPFENVSRLKKIIVVTGIFVSLFGGMFLSIIAIENFKNYYNPYLFGFTFGLVGLLTGLFVANKLKSKIVLNPKMQQNYSQVAIHISIGFIGLALLLGHYTNSAFANKEKSNNYYVTEKKIKKGGYKRIELNILVINVDGVNHRVITNPNYWNSVSVGQYINASIFKSRIGFDYLTLTNEN